MEQHSPPLEIAAPAEAQKKLTSDPSGPKPRKYRVWIWILLLVLLAAGTYYFWSKRETAKAAQAAAKKAANAPGSPVDAAKAVRGNIGVYVSGLGAVTPIYTVTVQTRVDGQLMEVLYKEGDMVKQGDKLATLDPRPYEAQLTQ